MTGIHRVGAGGSPAGWVLACTAAETLGMAAASYAARTAPDLSTPAAYSLVLGAGLVEGTALGVLQARHLGRRLGLSPRRRAAWVGVTVTLAGLGWAAGSVPTVASDTDDGSQPALVLVLLGAAAIGLTMGALLGAAQAAVLRGVVRHPWRWVGASTCGWSVAMVAIFVGAGSPGADWSTGSVVLVGLATGAAAGAALGLLTGAWFPSLDGPPPSGRVVLALLGSPARRLLGSGLVGLRVTGVRTGRTYAFPVQAASDDSGLVVVPGHPEGKTWWRNLRTRSEVQVLRGGSWRPGTAAVLEPGTPAWDAARAAYLRRWPRVRVPAAAPIVTVITPPSGPRSRTPGDSRQ